MKEKMFDTQLFTNCCLDLYYCLRCDADSVLSISVLETVYPMFYIELAVKVLLFFCTIIGSM